MKRSTMKTSMMTALVPSVLGALLASSATRTARAEGTLMLHRFGKTKLTPAKDSSNFAGLPQLAIFPPHVESLSKGPEKVRRCQVVENLVSTTAYGDRCDESIPPTIGPTRQVFQEGEVQNPYPYRPHVVDRVTPAAYECIQMQYKTIDLYLTSDKNMRRILGNLGISNVHVVVTDNSDGGRPAKDIDLRPGIQAIPYAKGRPGELIIRMGVLSKEALDLREEARPNQGSNAEKDDEDRFRLRCQIMRGAKIERYLEHLASKAGMSSQPKQLVDEQEVLKAAIQAGQSLERVGPILSPDALTLCHQATEKVDDEWRSRGWEPGKVLNSSEDHPSTEEYVAKQHPYIQRIMKNLAQVDDDRAKKLHRMLLHRLRKTSLRATERYVHQQNSGYKVAINPSASPPRLEYALETAVNAYGTPEEKTEEALSRSFLRGLLHSLIPPKRMNSRENYALVMEVEFGLYMHLDESTAGGDLPASLEDVLEKYFAATQSKQD